MSPNVRVVRHGHHPDKGIRISENDWRIFLDHAAATLSTFKVPEPEQRDVVGFVLSLKAEIVE